MIGWLTPSTIKRRLVAYVSQIRNLRVKLMILGGLHILRRPYYGVYIDPILSCNLRCKMCYFSDPVKEKSMRGALKKEDSLAIAQNLFPKALKLQIGCGAEPTLSKEALHICRLGKQYKIPFISMISNGNLLKKDDLLAFFEAGLDELAISLHGTDKDSYEFFMGRGRFDRFVELLEQIKEVRQQYPNFRVRINYTVNSDNLKDLIRLPELLAPYPIHTVQIRPIQKIGESAYNDFSMNKILADYDEYIAPVVDTLKARGIDVLCPNKQKLAQTEAPPTHLEKVFESLTYYYVSPQTIQEPEEDFRRISFGRYAKSHKLLSKIVKNIFASNNQKVFKDSYTTKKMNY